MSAAALETPDRPEDGVDLWLCRLDAVRDEPGLVAAYHGLMTEEERARGERFRFEADRLRHAAARALLRTTLSHYGPRAPQDWRFVPNAYAKPHLEAACAEAVPRLSFNLSHSSDVVVLAAAVGRPVGVDVERICDRGDLMSLAGHCFAPEETQTLQRLAEGSRRRRFFEHWTLKEAYIKARGMGLSLSLCAFWFGLGSPGAIRFATREPDQDAAAWSFWHADADGDRAVPEYPVALCVGAPSLPEIRVQAVTPLVGTRRIALTAGRSSSARGAGPSGPAPSIAR